MLPFNPKKRAIRALRQRNHSDIFSLVKDIQKQEGWLPLPYSVGDLVECENSLLQCRGVIGAPAWMEERMALLGMAAPPSLEEVQTQMQASADVIKTYEIISSRENAG